MEDNAVIKSVIHYHICWSDTSLDWKPCRMEEEARMLAEQIKKRDEIYTIVERDGECERCKVLRSKATAKPVNDPSFCHRPNP